MRQMRNAEGQTEIYDTFKTGSMTAAEQLVDHGRNACNG